MSLMKNWVIMMKLLWDNCGELEPYLVGREIYDAMECYQSKLIQMNDTEKLPFPAIADWIEANVKEDF